MFIFNLKKIRKLIEQIDAAKRPADLDEAVKAIEKNAPAPARVVFKNRLRQELIMKHRPMAGEAANDKESIKKSFMKFFVPKKAFSFAIALVLILAVSGFVSYPLIPAPQVEGYSLKESVRMISYNAPIKVVFSQMMDHGSVEAAFHIEPAVKGRFEWNGNALLFYPENSFKVGDAFAVTVEKKAKSIFQKSLEYDYEENFEITGPPQVLLFNPVQDSEGVDVSNKITVLFDRQMTGLTTLENGESKFPDVKIDPPVNGKFKWLGTSSFTFIPDRLKYSTKYTFTIPKGTASADGGRTDQDFVFSFTTPKPLILQSLPFDGDPYNGPDTVVRVDFNQKMDLARAKQYLHLYSFRNGEYKSFSEGSAKLIEKIVPEQWQELAFDVRYATNKDLKDNANGGNAAADVAPAAGDVSTDEPTQEIAPEELVKTLILAPSSKPGYNSTYFVKIDAGMPGSEGTFALEQAQGTLFKTVGDVKVVSTNLPAGSKPSGDVAGKTVSNTDANYAEVVFAHPMDVDSATANITASPLKKDKDTGEEVKPTISGGDVSFSILYSFDPSTDYTITVKAGTKDKFGQSLKADSVVKFRTPALPPGFQLEVRSNISILDSNKAPVYYVKTTNVNSLHFNFRKLSSESFNKAYSSGSILEDKLRGIPDQPVISWDKKVKTEFNKEVTTQIDFNKETGAKLEPGIYYFEVLSPDISSDINGPTVARQVFVLTGTGLALKLSSDEMLVWATSLKDGTPVKNLDVKMIGRDGKESMAKTDTNGLASFKLPAPTNESNFYNNDYTVEAEGAGGFTIAHNYWSEGVDPWNFNINYDPFQPNYYIYSYTDRPIYRPGDTVYFKGLVRKDADANFKLPEFEKVHVTVKDSQYETVFEKDLDLNANGTYNGDYTLGAAARTGSYTIETLITGAPGPEYLNKFYTYFRIAEYRKPDYELTIKADKENYVNGDKAKIDVKGAYFFGAPMPGAKVEYTVRSQDYYFFLDPSKDSPFASQWYSFSDEGYMCYWGCEGGSEVVAQGKGQIDANGAYSIDLPLDIGKKKVSQFYTVEVTAFDLNNQSVSNRVILPVHKGEFYTGILSRDYVVSAGDPAKFDVVSVDFDGKPVPGKQVEVSFFKREWNTTKKKNVDSDFYYDNSYEDKFVEKKTVVTDDKGHSDVSFTAKDGGYFKATASATDGRGNQIISSTTAYVTSDKFVNWGRENNDKIEIVADKNEYKPGDTAKLLVKSPYQNVWALVTQERKGILHREVKLIKSNSETIEIPITNESIPNVFVSVLLVKGDSSAAGLAEPASGTGDERDVAAFKLGYATLQVNTSSRELKMEVTPAQQKYHPGDEVTLNVKTTDYTGKSVAAEVSVAVVDKSVLSLTDTVTADLLNAFYRQRLLGVSTADTLTKAISRVNVQVEAGMKGGGGAKPVKRGVFKDTAYWQAVVNTDENGVGTVKFKLPDNLTTWQALAIGITKDTLVGSQKSEFLVTKDVLVRPVLPRFLMVSDTLKVGGIVHNYLGDEQEFDVSLDATGVDITGAKTVRIKLKPGEEQKVEWNISVKDEKNAVFNFKAEEVGNGAVGDILEQTLPIEAYSFPEVVATSGTIDDDNKHVETVWLPLGIDPTHGELTLSAAPTLANSITQGLQYLMTYPYGCAEQTASSLLPNAVIKQVLNLPALKGAQVDEKQLQKNVETAVAALYKVQKDNGSWGIWQESDPNTYLTAYVLFALNETKKAGYAVDANVMSRAKDYLVNYLNGHALSLKESSTSDPLIKEENRYEANVRAYILYVLAETGSGDMSWSNNLYDYRDDLNLFSKAYLAMTYWTLQNAGSLDGAVKSDLEKKITALKNDILSKAKESPRGVHFEETMPQYRLFDTNTRTTALVLQMLSRIEPANPYIPKILRNMLMEKKDGRFQSTQETSVALMALVDYLKNSKELEANFRAVITVNGTEKLNKAYMESNISDKDVITIALKDLMQNNQDNEITLSKAGSGKLYYDVNLKYFLPTERIAEREEGIVVTQEYFAADDKKMENPVTSVAVGQNLKGKMTVIVPEDRYYVMVEDYLPAGLEGVDFNLNTSQAGLQANLNGIGGVSGKGGGKGFYDYGMSTFNYNEVRDDRVMYFADFLPKGVYEIEYFVRATSPGIFHDLPALAQELYFPEVFGRSEGRLFEVKNV
jgi:alpha-2-macroglobulin